MTDTATRRSFFGWTRNALAATGLVSATPSLAASSKEMPGEDYYDKLGVTKIINAAGTYTALTASIMPPSVQAAVARSARNPVRLGECGRGVGAHLGHGRLHDGGKPAGGEFVAAGCIEPEE
jgi:L-seryl-tRNA(Ser) seleniumtransferase